MRPAALTFPSITRPGVIRMWNFMMSLISVTFSISVWRPSS